MRCVPLLTMCCNCWMGWTKSSRCPLLRNRCSRHQCVRFWVTFSSREWLWPTEVVVVGVDGDDVGGSPWTRSGALVRWVLVNVCGWSPSKLVELAPANGRAAGKGTVCTNHITPKAKSFNKCVLTAFGVPSSNDTFGDNRLDEWNSIDSVALR